MAQEVGYATSSLKACRRGEKTINGKNFVKLLNYLTTYQQNIILNKVQLLDLNWHSKKGTQKIIELSKDFGLSKLGSRKKSNLLAMIKNGDSLNTISQTLGISKTTIYYYSRKIKGGRTYIEPEFETNYSEVEGEVVGIFSGDGSQHYEKKKCHYYVNVHFGHTDYVWYVKKLFENYFNKKFRLQEDKNGNYRLVVVSKKIFMHFKNYIDYIPQIKHCTVRLKNLDFPKKFLIGFLRGLLDTDGTIALCKDRKFRIGYYTTSHSLAQQIKEILCIFDIKCGSCVSKRLGYKDLYQVYILAGSNMLFLETIKPFKQKRLGLLV
ncbi:MAG: LAGLIDADG family homing endonuclease [archaeon]|nr:LAGLIDADG family homing endonuclease [archaeon]